MEIAVEALRVGDKFQDAPLTRKDHGVELTLELLQLATYSPEYFKGTLIGPNWQVPVKGDLDDMFALGAEIGQKFSAKFIRRAHGTDTLVLEIEDGAIAHQAVAAELKSAGYGRFAETIRKHHDLHKCADAMDHLLVMARRYHIQVQHMEHYPKECEIAFDMGQSSPRNRGSFIKALKHDKLFSDVLLATEPTDADVVLTF